VKEALEEITSHLEKSKLVGSKDEVEIIAHRVVHGGDIKG